MSAAGADPAVLSSFVYEEARLIDEKRFEEWYELFTEDAYYWMPLTRNQPDGENHTSLFYEDKLLLRVRIERLRSPRSFSQHQPSFCQHVLQAPILEAVGADGASWTMRVSRFLRSSSRARVVSYGKKTVWSPRDFAY